MAACHNAGDRVVPSHISAKARWKSPPEELGPRVGRTPLRSRDQCPSPEISELASIGVPAARAKRRVQFADRFERSGGILRDTTHLRMAILRSRVNPAFSNMLSVPLQRNELEVLWPV